MKRLLFMLFVCLSATLSAQTDSTSNSQLHAKFKGVPIDGSINQFVEKLKLQGFSFREDNGSYVSMTGDFAGEENCMIGIYCTPVSRIVCSVSVIVTPDRDSWRSVKGKYNFFKGQFVNKYGEPFRCKEEFERPYYEGDGYELQGVSKKKCNYYSEFRIPFCTMSVKISDGAFIIISYEDGINMDKYFEERDAEISNDI